MFVDGKWTGGSAGSFAVLDPSTGAELASVPRAGEDDVRAAVSAAAARHAGVGRHGAARALARCCGERSS